MVHPKVNRIYTQKNQYVLLLLASFCVNIGLQPNKQNEILQDTGKRGRERNCVLKQKQIRVVQGKWDKTVTNKCQIHSQLDLILLCIFTRHELRALKNESQIYSKQLISHYCWQILHAWNYNYGRWDRMLHRPYCVWQTPEGQLLYGFLSQNEYKIARMCWKTHTYHAEIQHILW